MITNQFPNIIYTLVNGVPVPAGTLQLGSGGQLIIQSTGGGGGGGTGNVTVNGSNVLTSPTASQFYLANPVVTSFNTRTGAVTLVAADVPATLNATNFNNQIQVSGTTPVKKIYSGTGTISGDISPSSEMPFSITVTGVSLTANGSISLGWNLALPQFGGSSGGIIVKQAYVSANNTVIVILYNTDTTDDIVVNPTIVRVTVMEF